jgi:DNA-binding CsgD family transcriptional regulator
VVTEVIGREAELELIERWLDGPLPAALLIEGEAGIGKTTLWRAGVEHARNAGQAVLACTPSLAESEVGFAALGDLLRGLDTCLLESLPEPQRRALEGALLLRDPERPPEGRALGLGLVSILGGLASESRVLVAVDDTQWLDAASRGALTFAARRLAGRDIGFLVARRAGEGDETVPLELDRELQPGALEICTLGPLSLGALGRLVRERLDLRLRRPELRRLEELSGGNPFFAVELAPTMTAASTERVPLPASLSTAIQVRLAELDDATLHALLVAAVSPTPTLPEIERVTGCADAWLTLESAREAAIVTVDGDSVIFLHPLYAAAAVERASPKQRAEAHRHLAVLAETPEIRARHLAASTRDTDEEVAAAVETGARDARLRGAPELGAELAGYARALTPESDDAAAQRRGLLEADCLQAAGDIERERDLLTAMADEAPQGRPRAEILFHLARAPGNFEESIALCDRALVAAAEAPDLAAEIGIVLSISLFVSGSGDRALAQVSDAIELAATAGDELLESRARALHAMMTGVRGDGWDLDPLRRGAETELASLERPDPEGPSMWLAQSLHFNDLPDEARTWTEAALERAVLAGDVLVTTQFRSHLATIEVRAGRFPIAHDLAVASLEEEEQIGWEQKVGESLELLALIDAWLGREEDARSAAERGVSITRAGSEQLGEFRYRIALTVLELGLEHWEAAAEHAEAGLEAQRSMLADASVSPLVAYAAEAHAALGNVERAEELTRKLESDALSAPTPRLRMVSLRCRGVTQAAAGDLDAAVASLAAGVNAADELASPNEQGRMRLLLGRTQRRLGRRMEARATLEQAIALLDESGARLFADQARAELARVSGRRPGEPDELTEAERRIADLVAEGRSNKEVAGALSLSVKTVEVTLTRVYRKLGVRSRSQLARRSADSRRPPVNEPARDPAKEPAKE